MLHNKLPFVEIWFSLNATKLNNVKYFADVERKHVYIEDLQESWPILCSFLAVNFAIFGYCFRYGHNMSSLHVEPDK